MKKIESCNLCGKKEFITVVEGEDRMYLNPGKFKLVKCKNCELCFVNPQPEDIGEYYPKTYYSFSGTHKRSKIAELMYKTYFSDKLRLIRKVMLYPLYPLIRGAYVRPGARILDIGSGNGVFLSRMKQLGMEVHGVDPFILEDVKELNIRKARLEDSGFEDRSFDVITMNNVLEHVDDPNESFEHIKRLLKKDGRAIIGVPNIDGLMFKIFNTYWAELDLPRHLYQFNRKTLTKYAKKHGLKVTKVRYNSVPFEITGSLSYFFNRKGDRRPLGNSKIAGSRLLYWAVFPICHLLILLRMGGRIEVTLTHP